MRHTLDPVCDCETCERARFEHRAVVIALVLITAVCLAALLWVSV